MQGRQDAPEVAKPTNSDEEKGEWRVTPPMVPVDVPWKATAPRKR